MNRFSKKIIVIIAIVLLSFVCVLSGCLIMCTNCTSPFGNNMPDKDTVEEFVIKHDDDIQIVTKYLLELGNNFAVIESSNGQIYKDVEYKYTTIEDSEVKKSISNLWKAGCRGITRDTQYNSISFLLWRNNFFEIDCGFACPIDDSHEVSVNYQTELTSISNNWYYYVVDYEKWRLSH